MDSDIDDAVDTSSSCLDVMAVVTAVMMVETIATDADTIPACLDKIATSMAVIIDVMEDENSPTFVLSTVIIAVTIEVNCVMTLG
jgi:hypothetical protein